MSWKPFGPIAAMAGAGEFPCERDPVSVTRIDNIAVISLCGPIDARAGSGYASYDQIFSAFAESRDASAIVFDIDSPGGVVCGCFETARSIIGLQLPPVFSVANYTMASAGYALACVGDRIVAPPTARVGSVGVMSGHVSVSRANDQAGIDIRLVSTGERKLYGYPEMPLNEDALTHEQGEIEKLGAMFFDWVKERRGIDASAFKGDVFLGADAAANGLTDGIATLGQVLGSLLVKTKG